MKSKLSTILGVWLALVLAFSLAFGMVPAFNAPQEAQAADQKWDEIPLPKISPDDDDDYVLYPGSDIVAIAQSPDGETLFAASDDYEIFKSTDGGYTWSLKDTLDDDVVDIVVSPDWEDDETVFVATDADLWESVDGGDDFALIAEDDDEWSGEYIEDLDVTLDGNHLAMLVGTSSGVASGDVYIYWREIGMAWESQDIGSWDVLAVAFSPNFEDDEAIMAVVTSPAAYDNETRIRVAFSPEEGGAPWGESIDDGEFLDMDGVSFECDGARMAFPDDFDVDSIDSNICWVGLNGPDVDIEDDQPSGDVYEVEFKSSSIDTEDLNVRGKISAFLPTGVDVVSIDAVGNAEEAFIMVGTDYLTEESQPDHFFVYWSDDGGDSFEEAEKQPTGGDQDDDDDFDGGGCNVLLSPEFLTDGMAYAGTYGEDTSAFSLSEDSGETWNQIGLIDYGLWGANTYHHIFMAASWFYTSDETMYMVTGEAGYAGARVPDDYGALWKTTDNGMTWVRIWSYANMAVLDAGLARVHISGDGTTVFATDYVNGEIWRSSDAGLTFPTKIRTKEDDLMAVKFNSPTSIMTGHEDGVFYYTTKSGRPWNEPEDSEMGTGDTIKGITTKGDLLLLGCTSGQVYFSDDAGETIVHLGDDDPTDGTGWALPTFDPNYDTNTYVYADVALEMAGGIWRIEVDEDDPDSTEWERIDGDSPFADDVQTYGGMILGGIYYAAIQDQDDSEVVGVWRSANVDAEDIDDIMFVYDGNGLDDGVACGAVGAALPPNTLFWLNMSAGNYFDELVVYTDLLSSAVTLVSPADAATGVGVIPSGQWAPILTFRWDEIKKADMYQLQIALDDEFESTVFGETADEDAFTTGQNLNLEDILMPNEKYYWRVRVADYDEVDDDLVIVGAPLLTPWSEVWTFTTALGSGPARPNLVSPYGGEASGGVNTPLKPAFQWTQVYGATGYKVQVSQDSAFATVLTEKEIGAVTSWLSDKDLTNSNTYFWRVMALGPSNSPWSDVGSFTTLDKAAEPEPPVIIPPAQEITPVYIWAIIGIGAALVIAVIVLIVMTRRPT